MKRKFMAAIMAACMTVSAVMPSWAEPAVTETLETEPEEDGITGDYVITDFFGVHTPSVSFKSGDKYTFTFKNKSNGENFYDNFIMAVTGPVHNGWEDEVLVVRADVWGWGGGLSDIVAPDETGNSLQFSHNLLDTEIAWEEWKTLMQSGAECEVTAERMGNTIIYTESMGEYNVSVTVTSGIELPWECKIFFTGEDCELTGFRTEKEHNPEYDILPPDISVTPSPDDFITPDISVTPSPDDSVTPDIPETPSPDYFDINSDEIISEDGMWVYSTGTEYNIIDGETVNVREIAAIRRYTGGETYIKIPETVDGKEVRALRVYSADCFGAVKTLEIPQTIDSIMEAYIIGCSNSLEKIVVDEENKNYKDIDGVLFTKDGETLLRYPSAKENTLYNVPEGVKIIERDAFLFCKNLIEVNIPEGTEEIQSGAFGGELGIGSIRNITVPKSIKSIGAGAFYKSVIYVYKGSVAYRYAKENNCSFCVIDEGAPEINGNYVFNLFFDRHTPKASFRDGEKHTFKFTNRSNGDANWDNFITVIAGADETGTEHEALVVRADAWGWGGELSDFAEPGSVNANGLVFESNVDDWDAWVEMMRAGAECEVTVERQADTIIYDARIGKYNVSLKATSGKKLPDDLYVFFTGERCTVTFEEGNTESMTNVPESQLEYTVLNDETVEITGYKGNDSLLILPEKIDGRTVTSIVEGAFSGIECIETVAIPETVVNIGASAFENCVSLNRVFLPSGLKKINEKTFYKSYNLRYISIPSEVTYIGDFSFFMCNVSLDSLSKNVSYIGRGAFAGDLLYGISEDNETYKSENNAILSKDGTVYVYGRYSYDENDKWVLNIPDGAKEIYDYAAYGEYAEEVYIPDSVVSIGDYAFANTNGFQSVTIPDSVVSIGDYAFADSWDLKSLIIPKGTEKIGKVILTNGTIYLYKGTPAETAAKENKVSHCIISENQTDNISGNWYIDGFESVVTPAVYLADGEKYIFTFNNKSNGEELWDNYVINIGDEYNNYYRLRADAFGWCEMLNENTGMFDSENFHMDSNLGDINNDMTKWNELMQQGTDCTVTLSRKGNTLYYEAVMGEYTVKKMLTPDFEIPEKCPISFSGEKCELTDFTTVKEKIDEVFITSDGLCYIQAGNNTVEITGCFMESDVQEINIPSEINGMKVVSVADRAFYGSSYLRRIIIPDTVENIGNEAIGYLITGSDEAGNKNVQYGNTVIYAKEGSAAEKYAQENMISFCAVKEEPLEKVNGNYYIHSFFGAMTPYVVMKDGDRYTFTFDTKSTGTENWHNFNIILGSRILGSSMTMGEAEEILLVRADAWGWGGNLSDFTAPDTVGEGNALKFNHNIDDWSKWLELMKNGTECTVTIEKHKNTLAYTASMGTYKITLIAESFIALPDEICVMLSGDNCDITNVKAEMEHSDGANVSQDGWYYSFNADGGVTVTGSMSDSAEIVIPSEIDGYIVTAIGDGAFKDNAKLKKLIISEGITAIGDSAFEGCVKLTRADLPKGLKTVGNRAFYDCSAMIMMDIPKEVTAIGKEAFGKCSGINEITIPDGVTVIEEGTFLGCSGIQKIILPETVLSIGKYGIGYRVSGVNDVTGELIYGKTNVTIAGYPNTAAETYAKENDIPFSSMRTISSENTDIKMDFAEDTVNNNVVLDTKEITEEDEDYKKIDLTDMIKDEEVKAEDVKIRPFEIKLVDENNKVVQPKGTVIVKIPCPKGFDGSKCKVYFMSALGKMIDMMATYTDGYICFETTHFSTYVVTETEMKSDDALYGDINGDGEVNIKDAVLIKKHLAGYDNLRLNMRAADTNGDAAVNINDAVRLLKSLAGDDVALGE